ncbi:MAG: hypothetical protein CL472_07235 [Acidobacteria bacterium]|nr:hypothetical protein [Acidobacteriota bacterium]
MDDKEHVRLGNFVQSVRNMGLSEEEFFVSDSPKAERVEDCLNPRGQSFLLTIENMQNMQATLDAHEGVRSQNKDSDVSAASFSQMLELDEPQALSLIGLRRHERMGDMDALASGMSLMAMADMGMASRQEVVEMVAPDLADSGAEMVRHSKARLDREDRFIEEGIKLGFYENDLKKPDGSVTDLGGSVAYDLSFMERAQFHLDKYDGVEPKGQEDPDGAREFFNMLDRDDKMAIAYVGMRRLEREDETDRLRASLVLMDMAHRYRVPIEAVVEMAAPDLVPAGAEMGGLNREKIVLKEQNAQARVLSKGLQKDDAPAIPMDRGFSR